MKAISRVVFAILIIVLSALLTSCTAGLPSEKELEAMYLSAVEDAGIAEPDEISRDLVAIVPYNKNLVWDSEPGNGGGRILLVTWTSWDGYNSSVGQSMALAREVWVTVAPEVKGFARSSGVKEEALTLRLEQLLGLPPNSGKTCFVEIWANPDDIFRPSPDVDITDHEAELDFPKSAAKAHIDWFNDLKSKSYTADKYPWTRLGYTYDWARPDGREFGLSEFVIRQGATVGINSVAKNAQYCQ